MAYKPLPVITDELIDYLDRIYPDVCPEPSISDRELGMRMGAIQLIRGLKRVREKQRETVLGEQRSVS